MTDFDERLLILLTDYASKVQEQLEEDVEIARERLRRAEDDVIRAQERISFFETLISLSDTNEEIEIGELTNDTTPAALVCFRECSQSYC